MKIKDTIKSGNAPQITEGMYQILSAVADRPPTEQVQATAMAFMIVMEQLKLNMLDTLQTVRNILEDHSGQRLIRCAKMFVQGEIGVHFDV